MDYITFELDENKKLINQRKHGISFEEAKTVFYDEDALVINDPDHSSKEDRFLILGISTKSRLLVVCHCCRDDESAIRSISARRASQSEAMQYNEKR